MTRYLITTSSEDARELQRVARKLLGLPRRGRHVGRGSHVPMTDDPSSPGWSREHGEPRKHPTREEWAYPIDETLRVAWEGERERLTEAERQIVTTHLATERDLTTEWDGARVEVVRAPR
jgi:hypothetical protein